jgi:endo-1,3-1,4-beta-glycanase ExoK
MGFLAGGLTLAAQTAAGSGMAAAPWIEEFDSLDTDKTWLIQLYSFDASGCNFIPENIHAEQSILKIDVTENTRAGHGKGYNAGDMGTNQFRSYGLYLVRMKPARMRGGVSAFFIMNRWKPVDWEHTEIDIEFLGKETTRVQLTTHDFQKGGTVWKSSMEMVSLGFDYTEDFHVYGILWTGDKVFWFADGKLLRQTDQYVPREPMQIRLNAYVGAMKEPGIREWLGPIDAADIPAVTEYDWVRYYPLEDIPREYSQGAF